MTEGLFNADRIVADACAVDGLDDFGDESYREPLEVLAHSLATEARLNAYGQPAMRQRLVDILATRLRVEAWLKRHPEIRDEELTEPLVIVGLPRTGTTMLHRTISADPHMHAPLWYETRFPCPELSWTGDQEDARIAVAKAEVAAMVDANPDLLSIHPMDAMGPDEELMLLEQSFYSFIPQALAYVPSYDAWLSQQDHKAGYDYLYLLLQFLQWQKKQRGEVGQRWALKAPHHLHFMRLVFDTFPDAKVVQSHRDPLDTIPSLSSMIGAVWRIYSDEVDDVAVGREWAAKFANGMQHTMEFRREVGDERFLDLWFADTVKQPLQEIQKVYDFLGLELTDNARQEMQNWQQFNSREQRPPHHYTLEQYGFTEAGLTEQFKDYREKFIL